MLPDSNSPLNEPYGTSHTTVERLDAPRQVGTGGARMFAADGTTEPSKPGAMLSFTLPWPPSDNGYYAVVRGRKILSAKGRLYRDVVRARAIDEKWPNFNHSRLRLTFEAWVPDRRRRDLDNLLKPMCDSLTYAGLWHDDEQIDDLRIYRHWVIGGMVKATVEAI